VSRTNLLILAVKTAIMKKSILLIYIMVTAVTAFSQDMKKFHLYKPEENAEQEIAQAVKKAKTDGKHVLIQVGGNWCIWCARFNDFISSDKTSDSLMKANYVVYHLNYSGENTNEKLLAKYRYPQRMGFPVFLILDGEGKLLHTQNSGYLEDGKKSYNRAYVISFLTEWSPAALNPAQYKDK
jgi:thioredoxin-related protein